ncbi:MAG: hypothetical protein ACOX6T_02065 [Myxococcales bacterium]|jgi:hypothetical protein
MATRSALGRTLAVGSALTGAGLALYVARIRPWHMRWNATDEELRMAMPGDQDVDRPHYDATWAITIDAPSELVWPWLVQMGEGRGGFYSYDFIENLMGMRVRSADRLMPEHQELKPGDFIPAGRGPGIYVKRVDPGRALVLGSAPSLENELSATWSTVLIDLADGRTRMISRNRFRIHRCSPGKLLLYALLDPGIFVMVRKWMLGIKQRAEALHARTPQPKAPEPPTLH